jgi:uncharacterized protein (DUF924 family)
VSCLHGAPRQRGRLAEVLVLDQFSRNVHHNTTRAPVDCG